MKTPAYWGIAGFPITHSLTPRLFQIVGKFLGITDVISVFIEAENIEEFTTKIDQIEGDIWLSCTTPLKHCGAPGSFCFDIYLPFVLLN